LDKSQKGEKYSSADFVINAGIPTFIDAKHAIAHNKIMVIDGQTVVTGSFNFTKAAEENNAENLLVIRSPELAAKYAANWKAHADHSDPYAGRTEGYSQTHRGESAQPVAPATNPVTGGYVASRNSAVVHKPDCKSAATISEKNLVRYNTREEAIQAGKKPCHECNP
jgi:phosphatidylserine/phosphatidylglycerophosphate/cardiolipin synthase-like enzyme